MALYQEELIKASSNGVEAALRFSQISLGGLERIVRIQLDASRQALDEQAKAAQELTKLHDSKQAIQHLNKLAADAVEHSVNHSRGLYEVLSETQSELAKLAEENIGSFNKNLINVIDSLAKNAPAGSDAAVNALKSGIAASAAAVNSLTKAAQQVSEFAGTSVKAATSATADAVKTATRKAGTTA